MDEADAETPRLQSFDQVIEGVLELREEQQALVGAIKEAFFMEQILELGELRLRARILHGLGLGREASKFLDLRPYLISTSFAKKTGVRKP